uniref:Lea protein- soybean n=1 Tax=uncultured bacterium contig00046 TaxID=1181532 RepID=A0A806JY88_9BACT|nr:Lea protein- soybean [uncultured bacterium contig00046]
MNLSKTGVSGFMQFLYYSKNMTDYLAEVQKDGHNLQYVPEELRTPELCLAAVKKTGNALRDVPIDLRTEEICFAAVSAEYKFDVRELMHGCLGYVPAELKTAKMCLAAVKSYGLNLYDVPDHLKTLELCIIAVEHSKGAIKFVPKNIRKAVRDKIFFKK